ncbi:FAD/NAD(P)-binding domain-containing protein [Mollisia scopiformis]|uniref:FAD/NAD(P)-binding domain-containing protein n=1 Tax=Mollisia scopiformis TaxID=149040 RepID=A0A194WZ02_MOLSC|nr:FAD/NAD(P)-binding domain-containing protein [Mollisia scopiformis]KUJ12822.1 FAD/NAD(P)-binding domain-containing protein [Mollisia scopiformis]
MTTSDPRIAILGAGPGGLTIASLLTKHNIPYTLFDLRPLPTSSSPTSPLVPSGSLDLHPDSGLLALKRCGLYDKFLTLTGECSEDCIITDKAGNIRWQDNGNGGERPEIPRNSLTDLLLSSIPAQNIKWEHKVLSLTSSSSAKWTLHFSHQGSEFDKEYDLVIGADGAYSKTRTVLSTTVPYYSSVSCITLTIPHITTTHPDLEAIIGKGTYSASGDHKAVMAQRGSVDSARIYLMLQCGDSSSWLRDVGLDSLGPEELKTRLLTDPALFESWGKASKDLIAAGCSSGFEITANPLLMLPIGFKWEHVPNITLLGDAAHLITPFAGEGVNAAMLDALQLAEGIIESLSEGSERSIDDAVKGYEEKMFPRAEELEADTWGNLKMIFADNAPEGIVNFMASAMGGMPPPTGEA